MADYHQQQQHQQMMMNMAAAAAAHPQQQQPPPHEALRQATLERDALAAQCAAEGVLDDQFAQLLSLQDESNPDFVLEVVELYFDDSAQKAQRIAALVGLEPSALLPGAGGGAAAAAAAAGGGGGTEGDFAALDAIAHQFKGSSASLGARQVALACSALRDACQARDLAAARQGAVRVGGALAVARARLEAFAALERRRKACEAAVAAAGAVGAAGGPAG